MNTIGEFNGLSRETYDFFWDIAFSNNKAFFNANRGRYKQYVQLPLFSLAAALGDSAQDIDPDFERMPSKVVSHINRDTRFTKDKSPYRDHAWLGYRYPGQRLGESFCVYVEFERTGYGYGMGMYAPDAEKMNGFRQNILAKPGTFLDLVSDEAFASRFTVEGESYKKDRYPGAADELKPWLNRKCLTFSYFSENVEKTFSKDLLDEVKEGFALMKPVYRFLMGIG